MSQKRYAAQVKGKQYIVTAGSEVEAIRQMVSTYKIDPRKLDWIKEESAVNKAVLGQYITYSCTGWNVWINATAAPLRPAEFVPLREREPGDEALP